MGNGRIIIRDTPAHDHETRNGLILPQNGDLSRVVKKGTRVYSGPCLASRALALRPSAGSSQCSVWPSHAGPRRRPPSHATTPRTTWAPCFRTSSSPRSSRTRRRSSLIPSPQPYVVPRGRFREVYYCDSNFTMLGLVASGPTDLVRTMLDNF